MHKFTCSVSIALGLILSTTVQCSGPEWGEIGEAGSLPFGAQITIGIGPLGAISGSLGGGALSGGLDFEDMFLINILDPINFRATTDPLDPMLPGAFANFDTQLWLFKPVVGFDALGFLGNDNHPTTASELSLLTAFPTDGQPDLVDPGLYYVAITRSNNDPQSAGGEIFFQAALDEISGPDGPGGLMPVNGWTGDFGKPFEGQYKIVFEGVGFAEVPAPGVLALFAIAGLVSPGRCRRLLS